MASSWIINHDGLIVDYKDVTEGVLNYPDGERLYFAKIGDDEWKTLLFTRYDIADPYVIERINYAHSKAGTNKVNRYFVEILSNEFPWKASTETDQDMLAVFKLLTMSLASKIQYESEKYRYISEHEAVIVNNRRYTVGQTVYFNGQRYIVKKDGRGEGYLDLAEYPTGKGFIVTDEKRMEKEVVHHIDYTRGKVTSQAAGSGVFFDYTNGQYDGEGDGGTIISNNKHVERRLRASKMSEIRYWECVDFVPGYRSKTVTSPSGTIKIAEEKISSRK